MKTRRKRIFCAGTPEFAKVVFEELSEKENIEFVGLLTQPERPFGRKRELKTPSAKIFFQDRFPNLPIFQAIDENLVAFIKNSNVDIILVVAYGEILKKDFLSLAPCVNIHASFLPTLRGASPLQEMIMQAPKYFTSCIINISERLDSGEVLGFTFIPNTSQNLELLILDLAKRSASLLLEVLNTSNLAPLPQHDVDASFCKKIKKEHGLIDFSDALKVWGKFLAFHTWPQIHTKSGLKLTNILSADGEGYYRAGEILEISADFIKIGCTKGSLIISHLQQQGKNEVRARDFLNGARLKVGNILE